MNNEQFVPTPDLIKKTFKNLLTNKYDAELKQVAQQHPKPAAKQATLNTPMQDELLELINEGLVSDEGPLKDLFGSFDEEKFRTGVTNPALKLFKEEILPQVQEKFIAGNQVLGSGMRRGQLKAAEDLQSALAQLMYEAQNQQGENRLKGVNSILNRQSFENIVKQKGEKQSALPSIVSGLAKLAAAIAG